MLTAKGKEKNNDVNIINLCTVALTHVSCKV